MTGPARLLRHLLPGQFCGHGRYLSGYHREADEGDDSRGISEEVGVRGGDEDEEWGEPDAELVSKRVGHVGGDMIVPICIYVFK